MSFNACSTCGLSVPDTYRTSTCRYCGGLIENRKLAKGLNSNQYAINLLWEEWDILNKLAAPIVCSQEIWEDAVAYFNGCALCGAQNVEEKLLFIPSIHGGKLHRHNVLPACSRCAELIRGRQDKNPLFAYFLHKDIDKQRVLYAMHYLEGFLLEQAQFNWDEDELEIIFTCSEATSINSFDGIWARRVFDTNWPPKISVETRNALYYDKQEGWGISWRLLDETSK